jgi:hypothetical protein
MRTHPALRIRREMKLYFWIEGRDSSFPMSLSQFCNLSPGMYYRP